MALANDCLQKAVGPSEPYEFLTVYPHNTVPGHNLQDKINSELSDGDTTYNASVLFKSFPFNSSYPIPVYTPARIERSGNLYFLLEKIFSRFLSSTSYKRGFGTGTLQSLE